MYVLKNAWRCIVRAKGRNILIGLIALVIAVSACIGLSIRQAAQHARESMLDGMSVTASISYNRQSAMNNIRPGKGEANGGFDRDQYASMINNASALTLEEYEHYATAKSVKSFYYTLTAYLNGSESLDPVSADTGESTPSQGGNPFGGGGRGENRITGDFTVIGYSTDEAMTDFLSGVASVIDGTVFGEGSEELVCLISEELALYNDLTLGDVITLQNPAKETEVYSLTVSGIYQSTRANDFSNPMFGGTDPANQILMSANALNKILDASALVSTTVTDETTGRESNTALKGTVSATYLFASVEDYNAFDAEARALGLSDSYTIASPDVSAFENSLTPLNTLSEIAGWFLLVILLIGAAILIVLNIFNIRERKYEIGVLTAMGMKKWKVASQFICEILIVTMLAILVGAGIGTVSSVPVTNALLSAQADQQATQSSQMEQSFGRPGGMGGIGNNDSSNPQPPSTPPDMGGRNPFGEWFDGAAGYVTEIDSAMNLSVLWQMLLIGLLLTIVASAVSVLFVMRYNPLKILANRD